MHILVSYALTGCAALLVIGQGGWSWSWGRAYVVGVYLLGLAIMVAAQVQVLACAVPDIGGALLLGVVSFIAPASYWLARQ